MPIRPGRTSVRKPTAPPPKSLPPKGLPPKGLPPETPPRPGGPVAEPAPDQQPPLR